jgi:hypothetical protein
VIHGLPIGGKVQRQLNRELAPTHRLIGIPGKRRDERRGALAILGWPSTDPLRQKAVETSDDRVVRAPAASFILEHAPQLIEQTRL